MWCLFAGGGIRDSWDNLMEKTSDAGGMYSIYCYLTQVLYLLAIGGKS